MICKIHESRQTSYNIGYNFDIKNPAVLSKKSLNFESLKTDLTRTQALQNIPSIRISNSQNSKRLDGTTTCSEQMYPSKNLILKNEQTTDNFFDIKCTKMFPSNKKNKSN